MCYSARIEADYKRYVRLYGADISLDDFTELFWRRVRDPKVKIPKALEAPFLTPASEAEQQARAAIDAWATAESTRLQEELFKQRKRLADAERVLSSKTTKAATESRRIASEKVQWLLGKLSDLRRTEPQELDERIFPGHYAPVMVMENGRRVVKPMRYQCRPAGKPAFYDTKFPGTYNARRDSLEGFWKDLFGFSHGVLVASSFFENVSRTREDGLVENVVLEFNPQPRQDMLVACLWSRWTAPGEPELLSFAAITDEPPAEVAAAGHDRCVVPIKVENLDAWLDPRGSTRDVLHALLDDRAKPYYEHRLAA